MQIAFVLPGLHRVTRGAEVAFEAIAQELGQRAEVDVTLFGSGQQRAGASYSFQHVDNIERESFERWPRFPILRSEYAYEELTFVVGLLNSYRPEDFDLTVTCSYPFLNWFLRWWGGRQRPAHVFVTQNGDYPAISNNSEYRFFGCDGLICTNPEYLERNQDRWRCTLITNGVDPDVFKPGPGDRQAFDLPADVPVVLMVSALIPSKRIAEGIQFVSKISDAHLVVCGDGPERESIQTLGSQLMPGRFHLKRLSYEQMPLIYQTADCLLHLSLDEPFGNIYLEALASEMPIVSHNREVTGWILEDTSILVDTLDEAKAINGIKSGLNSKSTEKSQARRSLAVNRFSWQSLGQQYFEFFKDVLENFDSKKK
ncbi:MAG: glycosyltransferase family 4 protein [Aphanocapsa sp. GSE-SYN-MK-11-07L]|jgi:glycosyltransferase involved in cell wall biosynthesis|nr:glycosyltransferase family 4 protein [Aphanocapsa sp. GSE-SYN-MK-11-07L]